MTMNRRRFLLSTVATRALWPTLPLGGLLQACSSSADGTGPDGTDTSPALRIPPDFAGSTLAASIGASSDAIVDRAAAWTFGGSVPSPTIRFRPGDAFGIQFDNRLPVATNVHWHGLAVPPDMDGHPMDPVSASAGREYRYTVQPRPGTYWYHPHPDRDTGRQVYQGMAGFLIVDDGTAARFGLPPAPFEIPLLLQDKMRSAPLAYPAGMMNVPSGLLGDTGFVNGSPSPTLSVEAGVYRFRLLNGANARVMDVGLGDRSPFWLIGTDGGLLDRPYEVTTVRLGPGERVEVLIDFGRHAVGQTPVLMSHPFAAPGGMMGSGLPQGAQLQLMRFAVDRLTTRSRAIPGAFEPIERYQPANAQRTQTFTLAMGGTGMGMGMTPTINGRSFDGARIDTQIALGDLQVWDFVNTSGEFHPMHVHGAQFQVVSRSSASLSSPTDLGWKDTVLVHPQETVRIAIRFDGYRGRYLMHCHNLEHEDAGMMANVEVT